METKKLRLESQKRLGEIIGDFYLRSHEAKKEGQKIAWVSTGAPNEILWAMGFHCVFPEAHSATCGARHVGTYHCQVTEANHYETHLCTYARNDIGCVLAGDKHQSPVGGLPAPDVIVCANNSCITIQKWMENLSHYLKVPLFLIDTPYITAGISESEAIGYVKSQCLALIAFLEKMTGRKFDYEYFTELVRQSETSTHLYREILSLNKANPAPVSLIDLWPHNFPALALRHRPETEEHYRLLKKEIQERIACGQGAFPEMKYRIYWDGVPSWFALGSMAKKLTSLGLCLTASNYTELFGFPYLDVNRPLDGVVENTALFLLNRSAIFKKNFIRRIMEAFSLQGGIFQYALCCKPFTITQSYHQDRIQKELNLPTVSFEADLTDPRYYSEEAAFTRFETLREQLDKV